MINDKWVSEVIEKTGKDLLGAENVHEIEKTLALDTAPVTWPIGRGRDFLGTLNLGDGGVRLIEGDAAKTGRPARPASR